MSDLIILVADHRAELFFLDQLHCFDAKPRAENAIERGGRSASLEMAQDGAPRFLGRSRRDFSCDYESDSAVAIFAFLAMPHNDLSIARP